MSHPLVNLRLQQGWCRERSAGRCCRCHPANRRQICQSCGTRIRLDDCICNFGHGWVHSLCPGDEKRGFPAIVENFVPSATRPLMPEVENEERPRARRRLNFDRGTCQSDEDDSGDDEDDKGKNEKESEKSYEDSSPDFTEEQMKIITHRPILSGDPVCVDALAGCGKTTTIAALCNHLHETKPGWKLLYLVFGKNNETEAKNSKKFPKEDMEIRTTHAFLLRYIFGTERMHNFKPVGSYEIEDIIETVDLKVDLKLIFPEMESGVRKFDRILSSVASYIRRTVDNYQASADCAVSDAHVFWRAKAHTNLSARSAWRKKISVQKYVSWAKTFFAAVETRCRKVIDGHLGIKGISFDGYTKFAQLYYDPTFDFQVVLVDESQDLTPCQADLFWSDPEVRKNRAIFLFGDPYQQLFRFRGAGDVFQKLSVSAEPSNKYSLSGSFRFGPNIAMNASLVLKAISRKAGTITGQARCKGKLYTLDDNDVSKGTVLCRTNSGMYSYLFFHKPKKWSFLRYSSGGRHSDKALPIPSWAHKLEAFVNSVKLSDGDIAEDEVEEHNVPPFEHKGERFQTIDELQDFISDEGDTQLFQFLNLLLFLRKQKLSLHAFVKEIERSFVPMRQGTHPDNYNGIVIGTVHKAKGMEFDRVIIYNDFRFDMIAASVASEARVADEVNILYVAITRAKKELYLTKEVLACLNSLSVKYTQQPIQLNTNAQSPSDVRAAWEEAWRVFDATKPTISDVQDVPRIAHDDENNPLALDSGMSEEEQRRYLRSILLRYHPDKFFSKFSVAFVDATSATTTTTTTIECHETLKERLHEILRWYQKALRDLQNMDDGNDD